MGTLLAEKWIDKVIEVVIVSDRVLKSRLVFQGSATTIIFAYAPQTESAKSTKRLPL